MTVINTSIVSREVLHDSDTTVDLSITNREVLRDGSPIVEMSDTNREILRDADPEFHVSLTSREVLHSASTAIFLGLKVDLAELYFNPGIALDFTNSANRAQFHDVNLRPIPLGSDGYLPTGTPPNLYFTLQTADIDANDFPLNASGSGPMDLVVRTPHGGGYGPVIPSPSD